MAKEEKDYQALFEQIKSKPCKVVQLEKLYEAEGRKLRTRPHLLDRELQRVYDARTLEEIHTALETTGRNLQQLGVFSSVDVLVNEEPEVCAVLGSRRAMSGIQKHHGPAHPHIPVGAC